MRLLVCDFDYFFKCPDPGEPGWEFYDWGHSERYTAWLAEALWETRASAFIMQDEPLPLANNLYNSFWQRFQFSRKAHGYVSDSNFFSMHQRIRRKVHEVYLYDAHHDCGYEEKPPKFWDCANWGLYYLMQGADVVVNYPFWRVGVFKHEEFCYAETLGMGLYNNTRVYGKLTRQFDPGGTVEGSFDKVHICRSGAWVPPWCDHQFTEFVSACPVPLQELEDVSPRAFDETKVFNEVAVTKLFLDKVRADNAALKSGN